MANLSGQLSRYLDGMATRRWQPGVLDCGVFMADWARLVCGCDPIADVRGSYATVDEYEEILAREHGLIRSVANRLRAVGYVRTALRPGAGDIAVVQAPYAQDDRGHILNRPTGAICVAEKLRAVITSDMGVVISELPTLRAYRYA
jgi:hypothetical protein